MKKLALFLALQSVLMGAALADTPAAAPAGWTNGKITMGTIYDNTTQAKAALSTRPIAVAFTYAGQDGAGDRGVVVPLANSKIPQTIGDLMNPTTNPTQTMPVFVVYTANASGAGTEGALADIVVAANLQAHYQTLIIYAKALEHYYQNSSNPIRSTIILSPDFIGSIGKDDTIDPAKPLPNTDYASVRDVLQNALTAQGETAVIPAGLFTGTTLADYIQSINWVLGTFAPDIPYGWEDADWAGDKTGNLWLHAANTDQSLIASHVAFENTILDTLKVFVPVKLSGSGSATTAPSFLAFDKYGANPIFNGNHQFIDYGYLFNQGDWDNYMSFTRKVAEHEHEPLMLFQMPGAHLPENGETTPFQNLATAPDYMLGAGTAGLDFANFANIPGDMTRQNTYYSTATTAGAYLSDGSAKQENTWTQGHLAQLHAANVFAILWGGGGYATGIIPQGETFDDNGWLYNNIAVAAKNTDYVAAPQPFLPPNPGNLPVYPLNSFGQTLAYEAGDRATTTDKQHAYQCFVANWCNGAALYYAPGTGSTWQSAWVQVS